MFCDVFACSTGSVVELSLSENVTFPVSMSISEGFVAATIW